MRGRRHDQGGRTMKTFRVALTAMLVLLLASSAFGDWFPDQPYKWVQMPDLSPSGIDVNATYPYILADDFECTVTGPLTDIHIWGSWLNDMYPYMEMPGACTFTLSIHADIPASASPTGYSMPGPTLWMKVFPPGSFTVRPEMMDIVEGWMDPPELYIFPADWTCWQYNFFIDEQEAFIQQGEEAAPVVYWLDVQAVPEEQGPLFGWKTSLEHWNDDAVWVQGEEPYAGDWSELIYPPGHEMMGQSIDLAFVITGEEETPNLDWGDAPDPNYPTLGANNGANHTIVAGMFLGNAVDAEPDGLPNANATGDDMNNIMDEDGVIFTSPLFPGMPATVDVTASIGGMLDAWIDFNGDGDWADAGEQIFTSQPLVAGLNSLNYNVPGSATPLIITFARFRYSTAGGLSFTGASLDGEVEDYEIDIAEGEPYKWQQLPDLEDTGIDVNATEPFILADDFLCTEPGRLDEITIWGSWNDDLLPFMTDPGAVTFTLSIHADIPAEESGLGYSMPGEVLWFQEFPPGSFFATMYAEMLSEGWMDPPDLWVWPGDTVCWQYDFFIDPELAFHQVGTPDSNIVYWLDVQARPEEIGPAFGWKTSLDHWNDDAVWGNGMEPYPGPWYDLVYPLGHDMEGASIDLAFRIRSHYGTDVPDEPAPAKYGLYQNVPNPFNPATSIRFDVPAGGGNVTIEVFDAAGRRVATVLDRFEQEGRRSVTWFGRDDNGHELPSGVYFCKLTGPGFEDTKKMTLLK